MEVKKTMSDHLELQAFVSCLVWVLGDNLGPLEEQQVLFIAEP